MSKQSKRQLAGSGEALPAGVAGEVVTYANTNTLTVNTTSGTTTITAAQGSLSPGVWMIIPYLHGKESSIWSGSSRIGCQVTTNAAGTWGIGTDTVPGACGVTITTASAGLGMDISGAPLIVNVAATTPYYARLTAYDSLTSGTLTFKAGFTAIRLA